jgi:glycosyltransferase involved in cell wall biosynthesis
MPFDITIVLPTHRLDRFLQQAVDAVKASKGVKIKLIIIDDRKNKSSKLPFSDLILETPSLGYGGAVNSAKAFIDTEYVALMNSDDLITPHRFLKQVKALIDSNADMATCGIQKFSKKIDNRIVALGGTSKTSIHENKSLLISSLSANATWCSKSEYWFKNVHFSEADNGADWSLAVTLSKDFIRWIHIPENLYFYRVHNTQISKKSLINTSTMESEWESLNRLLGLPHLDGGLGLQLVFPNCRNHEPCTAEGIEKLLNWAEAFESLPGSRYSTILKRRILGHFIKELPFGALRIRQLEYVGVDEIRAVIRDMFVNFGQRIRI